MTITLEVVFNTLCRKTVKLIVRKKSKRMLRMLVDDKTADSVWNIMMGTVQKRKIRS